ncbi:MAG: hypothetical protein E7334_06795 [Clostridiales bacterium]|nr:hypothetical protein [Clostridiales bacterium]
MHHIKDKEPIKNMPADFFLSESSQVELSAIAQKLKLSYSLKLSKKSLVSKLSVIYTDMPQVIAANISKEAACVLCDMAQNGFELPSGQGEGMAELVSMALALPLKDNDGLISAYVTQRAICSGVIKYAVK